MATPTYADVCRVAQRVLARLRAMDAGTLITGTHRGVPFSQTVAQMIPHVEEYAGACSMVGTLSAQDVEAYENLLTIDSLLGGGGSGMGRWAIVGVAALFAGVGIWVLVKD